VPAAFYDVHLEKKRIIIIKKSQEDSRVLKALVEQ
jgi:hypothetical protein